MCCTKRNLPYICNRKRENSSVGRARPCQGRGRGFESRFSLFFFEFSQTMVAQMAELVDAPDLKSCVQ